MAMAQSPTANPNKDIVIYECSVCMEPLSQPASTEATEPTAQAASTSTPALVISRGTFQAVLPFASRTTSTLPQPFSFVPPTMKLTKDRTTLVATGCGHVYHLLCLQQWLSTPGQVSCPSCRAWVQHSRLTILYPSASSRTVPSSTSTEGNGNSSACEKQDCRELRQIQSLLTADNEALKKLCNDLKDEKEIANAQISSLKEDNAQKDAAIAIAGAVNAELKRKYGHEDTNANDNGAASASASTISAPPPKRGRGRPRKNPK